MVTQIKSLLPEGIVTRSMTSNIKGSLTQLSFFLLFCQMIAIYDKFRPKWAVLFLLMFFFLNQPKIFMS